MTTAPTFILLLALLGLASIVFLSRRNVVPAKPVPAMKVPVTHPGPAGTIPPKNSTPIAADLEPLVWDTPLPMKTPFTLRCESERGGAKDPGASGAQRIRERYLAARFPGALKCAADLADTAHVVKCARLLFEDGQAVRAGELLDLASVAHPEHEATWLANLEIAFLAHDPERYTRLAHAFHGAHPDSPDWLEVRRLGRRIAPMHPRFAGDSSPVHDDFDHSGPWPQMPNWIQANWDLTGDMAAGELRSRLLAGVRFAKHAYSAAA